MISIRLDLRAAVALLVCETLIAPPMARGGQAPAPLPPSVLSQFQKDLQKSYLELFEIAAKLEYSPSQIQRMRDYLNQAREGCVKEYKRRRDQYGSQLQQAQNDLKKKTAEMSDAERHDVHCSIQNLRALQSQTEVLQRHAIPIAYQNKEAKLDLIEKWPAQAKEIQQEIASGSYLKRRWGDVKDIGFREIAAGQKDDIKAGQDAVREMKLSGLIPHELEDQAIVDYVNKVAQKIAQHSDLQVPLHVTVLNSKEINAFALPGGFLYVERGILEEADDESELAGVIAHEISHDVARHSRKLMTKATIASIIYQAAQVAAVILTGGAAGIGVYYALQYGFYGLGLALNLELLGVSREFELQADQLGIQYAWNTGYDPTGFIRFFDKIATKEGYVNGVSWFYTHPPFYQRMVDAEREILFLPKKDNLVTQTSEFEEMKKSLTTVTAKAKEEEENRPSLLAPEQGCPAPQKIEYKPGEPVESICAPPATNRTTGR